MELCFGTSFVWKLCVWIISMKKKVGNGMELMFRSVVSWFKLDLRFCFENGVFWLKEFQRKLQKNWPFLFCSTPLRLGVGVHA